MQCAENSLGMPQQTHHDSSGTTLNGPYNRSRHKHNNSADTGSSHTLTALGYGLCKAFKRETPSRQMLSKEDRYGYLERTATKIGDDDGTFPSSEEYTKKQADDAPKSAGLRSVFARSIWGRSAMHFACDSRAVCSAEDGDSIALDSGFDHEHFDGDSGVGVSCENGPFSLEKELQRDTKVLVSGFCTLVKKCRADAALEIYVFMDYYVHVSIHRRRGIP